MMLIPSRGFALPGYADNVSAARSQEVLASFTVAGIDPGLANLGLGVVGERGRDVECLDARLVRTAAREDTALRLKRIFAEVRDFLAEWRPDALAIEAQYFHQQRGTAFKVGQAYGVVLLAAAESGVPVFEYGPMEVKQALVGTGRADKEQVLYMVRGILGLKGRAISHHSGDALALALTHLAARRIPQAAARTNGR